MAIDATRMFARIAEPDEVAGLGLSDSRLVSTGHTLPYSGQKLAAAIKALSAPMAELACQRITDPGDAKLVLRSESRKGTRRALLRHAPLDTQTRLQFMLVEDYRTEAVEGTTPEQALELVTVGVPGKHHRTDLLRRAARADASPAVQAWLAERDTFDEDVQLITGVNPGYFEQVMHLTEVSDELDSKVIKTVLLSKGMDLSSPLGGALLARLRETGGTWSASVHGAMQQITIRALRAGIEVPQAEARRALAQRTSVYNKSLLTPKLRDLVIEHGVRPQQLVLDEDGLADLHARFEQFNPADDYTLSLAGDVTPQLHVLVAGLPRLPARWKFPDLPEVNAVLARRGQQDPDVIKHVRLGTGLALRLSDKPSTAFSQLLSPQDQHIDAIMDRLDGAGRPVTQAEAHTLVTMLAKRGHLELEDALDRHAAIIRDGEQAHLGQQAGRDLVALLLHQAEPGDRRAALLKRAAGLAESFTDAVNNTRPASRRASDALHGITAEEAAGLLDVVGPDALKGRHGLGEHLPTATLQALREQTAAFGGHLPSTLATMVTLLDGEWSGSLTEAVQTAVVLTDTSEAA